MSARPASRPVHPCLLSLTEGTRGVEFSCWAHITNSTSSDKHLPNLVTASASTLTVYSVDPTTGTLRVEHLFGNLAGSLVFLAPLQATASHIPDALLAGFSGQPRMTVLTVTDGLLQAVSLLDLQPFLQSFTSTTTEDMQVASLQQRPGLVTVACILGGGEALVVLEIAYTAVAAAGGAWVAVEPYSVPLAALALPHLSSSSSALVGGMSTGFGDMISLVFLQDYLEPVVVVLHTAPGGRVATGRLGREAESKACAAPLYATALSVSVTHHRTAVLWSRPVTADALYLCGMGPNLLLCVGANTIMILDAMGQVAQVMAVNGWAGSTCPSSLTVKPNPVLKLALQLDGSCVTALSDSSALVALRMGQLYVLQYSSAAASWMLLPTGQSLGPVGEVAWLSALAFDAQKVASFMGRGKLMEKEDTSQVSMGLVLAASRLGDSLLLGYALEEVSVSMDDIVIPEAIKQEESLSSVKDEPQVPSSAITNGGDNGEYERILQLEEDALYATTTDEPHVVPPSDDEASGQARKRQRVANFTVVRSLTPLDTLVNPGPLGRACEGPIATVPPFLMAKNEEKPEDDVFGETAFVFPAGFGTSGGLALATVPGRDDRTIVAEEDCMDVENAFRLGGYVVLSTSSRAGGGIRVLRIEAGGMSEVDSSTLGVTVDSMGEFASTADLLASTLLGAGEFVNGNFALCVKTLDGEKERYTVVVLNSKFEILHQSALATDDSVLARLTPFSTCNKLDDPAIAFGCLWSSGVATVSVCKSSDGSLQSHVVGNEHCSSKTRMDVEDEDEDAKRLSEFYSNQAIVAVDVFKAPTYVFGNAPESNAVIVQVKEQTKVTEGRMQPSGPVDAKVDSAANPTDWSKLTIVKLKAELKKRGLPLSGKKADLVKVLEEADRQSAASPAQEDIVAPKQAAQSNDSRDAPSLDEEDQLLYSTNETGLPLNAAQTTASPQDEGAFDLLDYVAVCRQSGQLEVYTLGLNGLELRWKTHGCGLGSVVLGGSHTKATRLPSSQMTCAKELRFFSCGPSESESKQPTFSPHQCFCLMIETDLKDMILYRAVRRTLAHADPPEFHRIPMRSIGRPSRDQTRHFAKLVRKRIVAGPSDHKEMFAMNSLHRFSDISGQDGLFSAGSRPLWVVSERGRPTLLVHRTRHAAPAGGTERPVRAFCSGLQSAQGNRAFLTLHERVGRVGSQRLTLFESLSHAFDTHGLLTGGGLCLETVSMGVTVRQIRFIDDANASLGSHPLYALLVSREWEMDQRQWNSDGLTPEEREAIEEEKEKARIQKQVEADLGGFDLQSEWVEEIERENCFEVDLELGGAPPVRRSSFSLWIVDAAKNWAVVDSYEMGEYEHGITLEAMSLTEFKAEPARSSTVEEDDEVEDIKVPFIVVGTGIVDHNGEDVNCKGRTLLFRLTRSRGAGPSTAILSLTYEKEIFHGPVTSVSCLSVDGKNRLVIGAGSDVNIEQWGNSRLTQVGFFRATMLVLDIMHFKNFLLLSDAYDSLYFLVWRESDKSLTLLAKDYDPIPVYATGLMSRGAAMTFLCHDDRQNLQFFQYAPGEAAARGGNKLVCRADCHLGTQTTAFVTHFCRSSLYVHSATPTSTLAALRQQDSYIGQRDDDQRLGVFFGTTDGGLGSIVPLSEPVFWRLTALQSVMANALETNCALSPRAWRLYRRSSRRGGCRNNDRKKSVIDGDLLLQYADLPVADQEDLAASIGSRVDLILDNLLEVQCGSLMI